MRNFLFLPLFFVGVLIPEMGYSQTLDGNPSIPGKIWETTIQDPNLDYELKGSAIAHDGAPICLVLGSRPKGKSIGHQDFKLQIIDSAGRLQTSIDLSSYIQPENSPESRMSIDGISVTPTGIVFLALTQINGQVRFVGLDIATSKSVVNSMLVLGYPDLSIYKMLLTNSGTLLLLGSANKKGFIAEVDQSGKVLWHKTLDEQINVLLDAIQVANGFAVVGGKSDKNALAEIWAAEISLKGDMVQNHTFPGRSRFASLVKSSGGHYVIIYDRLDDRPESEIVQVVIQGLNPVLQPTWERTLVSGVPITSPFRIASAESEGYIVAGVKEHGSLWVSRLQEDGASVWTYSTKAIPPDYPRFHSVDILRSDKDFVLVSGLSTVSGREQQQVVNVTKFSIR